MECGLITMLGETLRMTQAFQILVAVYIPLPPDGKFSERTPMWSIMLYGFGCLVGLVLMYGLIRKTRREKMRRRHSERNRK